jgi:PKD repeat protein
MTLDLVDQGDYGVTVTALSPACNRGVASDPSVCPPPYTYVWDFSDGHTETTVDPVNSIHYEFGVPGPHSVTLTLIADNGYQGSRTSGPFDPYPPPPPTPEYYPEATIISGRTVEVSITTTFGIGTVHVYWGDSGSSQTSGAPVQHTYSTAGTYNIRVLVYDPGHITYEYEYNAWPPTQTCDTCPTLQVTVP